MKPSRDVARLLAMADSDRLRYREMPLQPEAGRWSLLDQVRGNPVTADAPRRILGLSDEATRPMRPEVCGEGSEQKVPLANDARETPLVDWSSVGPSHHAVTARGEAAIETFDVSVTDRKSRPEVGNVPHRPAFRLFESRDPHSKDAKSADSPRSDESLADLLKRVSKCR